MNENMENILTEEEANLMNEILDESTQEADGQILEIENETASDLAEKVITIIATGTIAALTVFIIKNWKKIKKWHLEKMIARSAKSRIKAETKEIKAKETLEALLQKMDKEGTEEA